MADERCAPPPELADRDGWHWLGSGGRYKPIPAYWFAERDEWDICGESRDIESATENGWRYVAPVATPEEVAAMRKRLNEADDRYGFLAMAREEINALRNALRTHTPYGEWCRDPLSCHASGRCSQNPVCGD